jgi:hypothetical protein
MNDLLKPCQDWVSKKDAQARHENEGARLHDGRRRHGLRKRYGKITCADRQGSARCRVNNQGKQKPPCHAVTYVEPMIRFEDPGFRVTATSATLRPYNILHDSLILPRTIRF